MTWHSVTARLAIIVAALGLSTAVVRTGVVNQLGRSDPVLAARWNPGDARVTLAAARDMVDNGNSAQSPTVRALITASLAHDVTQPAAIELRALDMAASGHQQRAATLFALSDTISRRSLGTRLWLIQDAVDHGNVAGALGNFDIALRTSSVAPDTLFPVLTRAASDPTLTRPIARLLDRPSDWRAPFLNYAISHTEAASDIANIVLAMRDRAAITGGQFDQALVAALINQQRFALARTVFAAFTAAPPESSLVGDPEFAEPARAFPFGWGLTDKGEAGAARITIAGKSALAFRSAPGGSGDVATQLLTLPPGRYDLVVKTAMTATDAAALPDWTITCAGPGGSQIALLGVSGTRGGMARAAFLVPAGCAAQWLALIQPLSDAPGGQSGAVAAIEVLSHRE